MAGRVVEKIKAAAKFQELLYSFDTKLRLSFDFLDPNKYANEETRGGEMCGLGLIHDEEAMMIMKYSDSLVVRKAHLN